MDGETPGRGKTPSKQEKSPGERTVKKLLGRRRPNSPPFKSKKRSSTPKTENPATNKVYSQTPSTIAEAQEIGEIARLNDDMVWALDGLESTSKSAREESLGNLVELLGSRRGRALLHRDGVVGDLMRRLCQLEFADHPELALGTASIFCMSTVSGHLEIFEDMPALELLDRILMFNSVVAGSSHLVQSVRKFLADPRICRLIPKEISSVPACICLACLAFSLRPNEDRDSTEEKKSLSKSGSLLIIVKIAMQESFALNDPRPTMKTVQGLWKLERCLSILEQACFACQENEEHLARLEVESGVPPLLSKLPFVQWLTMQVKVLSGQKLSPEGLKKECYRGFLGLLMNITEGNEGACKALLQSDGIEALCNALARLVFGCTDSGRETNLDSFKAWIDEISASLGVLINIVEAEPTALDKIKAITLQRGDSSTVSSTILEIVAKLFNLCSKEEKDPITSTNDNEVTLESLRDSEGQAMGSIIGAYSGILLGFLVVNDPEACAQAKCMLSSDSLRPLIGVIQKCFAFYKNVGALTPKTEASLQGLLVQLESQI
ncbi:hypothetical protein M9435_002027 [Picochlorum sp. BPE23]|nr:hypothetical protein M9435_002027 [Picochlorum sp. BPE23]